MFKQHQRDTTGIFTPSSSRKGHRRTTTRSLSGGSRSRVMGPAALHWVSLLDLKTIEIKLFNNLKNDKVNDDHIWDNGCPWWQMLAPSQYHLCFLNMLGPRTIYHWLNQYPSMSEWTSTCLSFTVPEPVHYDPRASSYSTHYRLCRSHLRELL